MDINDTAFWKALDELIETSKIIIDRPKGSFHPHFHNIIYQLDYGYLENTSSMDGAGIDIWRGSKDDNQIDGVMCIVDFLKRDSEIKLLIGCTEEEKEIIYQFHNESQYMKGVLVNRQFGAAD